MSGFSIYGLSHPSIGGSYTQPPKPPIGPAADKTPAQQIEDGKKVTNETGYVEGQAIQPSNSNK